MRTSKTNDIGIARANDECSPLSALDDEVFALVEHQLIAVEHAFSVHLLARPFPYRELVHVRFLRVVVIFHHVRKVDNTTNGYCSVGTQGLNKVVRSAYLVFFRCQHACKHEQ